MKDFSFTLSYLVPKYEDEPTQSGEDDMEQTIEVRHNVSIAQASADPEGGQGVRTPLENHKLYGFL